MPTPNPIGNRPVPLRDDCRTREERHNWIAYLVGVTVQALVRATFHRRHFLGLAAAALTAAVVLSACSSSGGKGGDSTPPTVPGSGGTSQPGGASSSGTPSSSASTSAKPRQPRKPVHVSLFQGDGST